MGRTWIIIGAVNGLLAVGMGAFGAHGLRDKLAQFGNTAVYQTGATYHMTHALALLAVGILSVIGGFALLDVAGWCFLGGIVLFSGSLYALAITNIKPLGAITPFGGTLFLAGWALLAISAARGKS